MPRRYWGVVCHHAPMTWWQTLLIAVVPVAVTSSALVAQQFLNDRREFDREAVARRDRSREREQEAHAELLRALYALWRPVEDWYRTSVGHGRDDETVVAVSLPLLEFDRSDVDEAMGRVQILGDPVVAKAAEEAYWCILQAAKGRTRSEVGNPGGPVTIGELRRLRDSTRKARKAYAESARQATSLVVR